MQGRGVDHFFWLDGLKEEIIFLVSGAQETSFNNSEDINLKLYNGTHLKNIDGTCFFSTQKK